MEVIAIGIFGVAGTLQKLDGALHILFANVRFVIVRPVQEGRIEAVGRCLQAVRALGGDLFAVQRLGHSLAHSEVARGLPVHVEAELITAACGQAANAVVLVRLQRSYTRGGTSVRKSISPFMNA